MNPWWGAAGVLAGLAAATGWGERRRKRRRDLDRVAPVDWVTMQVLLLIALAITVGVALHA